MITTNLAQYQKLGVLVATLTTISIGHPPLMAARAFALPPQEWPLPLNDDLAKCDKSVRAAILSARQSKNWGSFHFECVRGTVIRIQAASKSTIVKQWPHFVIENAKLFGVESADLRTGKNDYDTQDAEIFAGMNRNDNEVVYVVQTFHGAVVRPLYGNAPSSYRRVGADLIIATNFAKTKNWSFGMMISSTTASQIAEREWPKSYLWTESEGVLMQAADWAKYAWMRVVPNSMPKAKEAHLVILRDQPICIRCSFDFPFPIWVVTPIEGNGECDINAVTGELCKPCSTVAQGCAL